MEEHIDNFLDYIKIEKNFSDNTEINYNIDLVEFNNYLKSKRRSYTSLKYEDILVYIKFLKEERKFTPTSINRHLSSLRSFYNYLLLNQVVDSNPFNLVSSQKKELKLPNYMKYSEF